MYSGSYGSRSLMCHAMQLYHWVKCHKDNAGNVKPADAGEYQFAKYNKKVRPRNQNFSQPRLFARHYGRRCSDCDKERQAA